MCLLFPRAHVHSSSSISRSCSMSICAVFESTQLLPSLRHSTGQDSEHALGVVPADAGVGDGDTVFQTLLTLGRYFLSSLR